MRAAKLMVVNLKSQHLMPKQTLLIPVLFILSLSIAAGCQQEPTPTEPASKKEPPANVAQTKIDEDDPEVKDAIEWLKKQSGSAKNRTSDKDEPKTELAIDDRDEGADDQPAEPTIEIPAHWAHLFKEKEVWADVKAKRVIVGGKVCLNSGPLEMFICPKGTKEHEAVMSANALSSEVHSALLAVGAENGKAASWNPEYTAAHGPKIEIEMMWRDKKSNEIKKMSARDWIRNVRTKKRMAADFVFGGSFWSEHMDSTQKYYMGDSGEMVCLSNFSTATIDISVASSQDNFDLLYEAFTENIPPIGTQVYAVLTPGEVIGKAPPKKKQATETPAKDAGDRSSEDNKQDAKQDSPDTVNKPDSNDSDSNQESKKDQ